jgi:hypothetical protein
MNVNNVIQVISYKIMSVYKIQMELKIVMNIKQQIFVLYVKIIFL